VKEKKQKAGACLETGMKLLKGFGLQTQTAKSAEGQNGRRDGVSESIQPVEDKHVKHWVVQAPRTKGRGKTAF